MQSSHRTAIVAGGSIHSIPHRTDFSAAAVTRQETLDYSERFQRPSNRPPLPNPYSFAYFSGQSGESPTVTTAFQSPEGVILAYYGILKNASNMQGFSGGCGSVGDTGAPYPYAYQLFSVQARSAMPFQQFKGFLPGHWAHYPAAIIPRLLARRNAAEPAILYDRA